MEGTWGGAGWSRNYRMHPRFRPASSHCTVPTLLPPFGRRGLKRDNTSRFQRAGTGTVFATMEGLLDNMNPETLEENLAYGNVDGGLKAATSQND